MSKQEIKYQYSDDLIMGHLAPRNKHAALLNGTCNDFLSWPDLRPCRCKDMHFVWV